MLYQKQCEVYNYFSTSYFISLISGKKIITKPSKTRRSRGGENVTGHESLGHLKGWTGAAHDKEMRIKV